jgi:putative membrane protein|tara:strand:- start:5061 stop:5936 length:876 start_codon:yes stop_codon:yes gene_type:complete
LKKDLKYYLTVFLKGMAMGAADAVPGVSGGTIALLLGIYEELVTTIGNINLSLFKELKKNGFYSFWEKINGNFLLSLIIGIGISLVTFIKLTAYLFDKYPILIWSFFLGLIFATIYVIFKLIKSWNYVNIIFVLIAIFISFYLGEMNVMDSININLIYILISGIIAASAMIIPGISGALILVILGLYSTMINAINNLEIDKIATFSLGAIIGLLSFSKILKWMFNKNSSLTYSILLGFVIGSIPKVWPWKSELGENMLPSFSISENYLLYSIIIIFFGFYFIYSIQENQKK